MNGIFKNGIVDKKFKANKGQYIVQCLIIFSCVSAVLLLYSFLGGFIVASLGASSFILFIAPHTKKADTRFVIGGYVVGAVVGGLFGLLYSLCSAGGFDNRFFVLFASAAAALAAFLMAVFDFEHPPAAALALGLAVDPRYWQMALAALAGIAILCLTRHILRNRLIDLV